MTLQLLFSFLLNYLFDNRFYLYVCQLLTAKILLAGALRSLCIFAPFISFQAYGYFNICMGRSVAEMRPWCKARLPLLYNYIQSHYWYVKRTVCFTLFVLPHMMTFSCYVYALYILLRLCLVLNLIRDCNSWCGGMSSREL